MEKSRVTIVGSNTRIIPLEEAKGDVDFVSFMAAAKGDMKKLQYAVFFETDPVHEGINGNGLRFFASDLRGVKNPFMYAPVKFEVQPVHVGPIIGTIVGASYQEDEDGAGFIKTKGVMWTLEETYYVSHILNSLAEDPNSYGTSMECYYNPPHKCDYGVGDKKISYTKFLDIQDYLGQDYKGKGTIWRRANNAVFTGIAFTPNPADRQTSPGNFSAEEAGELQQAYASIVHTVQPDVDITICPHCEGVISKASDSKLGKDDGICITISNNDIELIVNRLQEDMMKGAAAKPKEVEELEELEEEDVEEDVEDEVEEETEEETSEEEVEEEDVEEGAAEEEESEEETEEEEVEEEPKVIKKKKIVKKVSTDKKPTKSVDKEALKLVKESVMSHIEKVFAEMEI
jgi:hypothetical protein